MVALTAGSSLFACADDQPGDDGGPACGSFDPETCTQLWAPTYANVYQRVLAPVCADGNLACHGDPKALGAVDGMVVLDEEQTFRTLTDGGFVEGDGRCSKLFARLVSSDRLEQMPPGAPLTEGDLCGIANWLADGAVR